MFDYQAIAALAAVIKNQSFQKAAERLYVTQSAVSQRIKNLENYYGEPLLIRNLPYEPTRLGAMLLAHFQRTATLEDELNEILSSEPYKQHISIAISRDSLETWFAEIMHQFKTIAPIRLSITADDQDKTLSYLQNGVVSACASTKKHKLSGCKVDFLGYFDYVLVATPAFKKQYFSKGDIKKNLIKAPAIIFDKNDNLHTNYLNYFFNIEDDDVNYHMVPSVAGFKLFALNGYAYALIPELDIKGELKQKRLINLFPDKVWQMPVYWHSWAIETKLYKQFNSLVIKVGRQILRQK